MTGEVRGQTPQQRVAASTYFRVLYEEYGHGTPGLRLAIAHADAGLSHTHFPQIRLHLT